MADYSSTPLAKKLGIREASSVSVIDAPDGFADLLGPLPSGAIIRYDVGASDEPDIVVLFSTEAADLTDSVPRLTAVLPPHGALWVAYPKKASAVPTDLSFPVVQRIGLDAGLVDNKSAAVDETWSGVRFVVRLADRAGWRERRRP